MQISRVDNRSYVKAKEHCEHVALRIGIFIVLGAAWAVMSALAYDITASHTGEISVIETASRFWRAVIVTSSS